MMPVLPIVLPLVGLAIAWLIATTLLRQATRLGLVQSPNERS
jgi:hypothetical protein